MILGFSLVASIFLAVEAIWLCWLVGLSPLWLLSGCAVWHVRRCPSVYGHAHSYGSTSYKWSKRWSTMVFWGGQLVRNILC